MRWIMITAVLLSSAACRTPPTPSGRCAAGQTRCADSVAEVCDSAGDWIPVLDCDEVSLQSFTADWVCCAVSDENAPVATHTCVAADQCEEVSR